MHAHTIHTCVHPITAVHTSTSTRTTKGNVTKIRNRLEYNKLFVVVEKIRRLGSHFLAEKLALIATWH